VEFILIIYICIVVQIEIQLSRAEIGCHVRKPI